MRLNEHAFHTWDIEVMFDRSARVPADAAAVIVDNLGLIARFSAKPTGDEREVRVRTSDPVRHFTVRLTPEVAELLAGDAGVTPDIELPAESFCRLVYGRLDSGSQPHRERQRGGARPAAPGLSRTLSPLGAASRSQDPGAGRVAARRGNPATTRTRVPMRCPEARSTSKILSRCSGASVSA